MSLARTWMPNQHGAWAMLVTPVIVGALLGGLTAWHAALLFAWLSAYCLNFFTGLVVKSRKPHRYVRQLVVYALLALLVGVPVLVAFPQLLLLGVVAAPVFAANLLFIVRRHERAWLNDVLGIMLATAVGFGAFDIGGQPTDTGRAITGLVIVAGYFVGTVFYVKTNIRERGSRRWLLASVGFHAVFTVLMAWQGWWVLAVLGLLTTVRAVVVPRLAWAPKRVGLLEIVFTVGFGLAVLLID